MSKPATTEHTVGMRKRYRAMTTKRARGMALDEFCETTALGRKHAIKVLRSVHEPLRRAGRKPVFVGAADVLRQIWLLFDQPCSKLLHPVLGSYAASFEKHRDLLDPPTKALLLRMPEWEEGDGWELWFPNAVAGVILGPAVSATSPSEKSPFRPCLPLPVRYPEPRKGDLSAEAPENTRRRAMKKDGKNENDGRPEDHSSQKSHDSHPLLPPRGDYHGLLSFQKAEVVYDLTFRFAHKFFDRGDRTIDQMVQAARSGKKNILEGSKAGRTSKETEIKLTNVARASLEELLDDYYDFLRLRDLRVWDMDSREALFVRMLGRKLPQTYEIYREFVETRAAEVVANIAICLVCQANYLIDQQLHRLEQDFLKEGGLRERMTRVRLEWRNGNLGKNGTNDCHNSHSSQNSHPPPEASPGPP